MDATHIAFAGGTGALTFMDIVGAIARQNLNIHSGANTTLLDRSSKMERMSDLMKSN